MLSEAPSGATVKVKRIVAGVNASTRLRELGVVEGTTVKVIRNPPFGPIIIEANGDRYALGKGLANKVEVELLSPN